MSPDVFINKRASIAAHRSDQSLFVWAEPKYVGVIMVLICLGLMSACSHTHDLSKFPPYNTYAGKTVTLVFPMPVEYDFKARKPSKVIPSGTRVTIRSVFLENASIKGPIIPSVGVRSQIFATIEYVDPVTKSLVNWNYPLGSKQTPYGYAEHIIAAPWEPATTPPLRYVGPCGKGFAD